MKISLIILSAILTGFAVGVNVEANTHALQISRITGAPYSRVLGAWDRLQSSLMTDTDCENFDAEISEAAQS